MQTRVWRTVSGRWFKRYLFLVGDIAAVTSASRIAGRLTQPGFAGSGSVAGPSVYDCFYVPLFLLVLQLCQADGRPELRRPERELEWDFKGVSIFFVLLIAANFLLFGSVGFSRDRLGWWYLMTLLFVLGARFSVRGVYLFLWERGWARERTLFAGRLERLVELERKLSVQRYRRHDVLGLLRVDDASGGEAGALGGLADWETVARRHGVQCMLLDLPPDSPPGASTLRDIARVCRARGIELEMGWDSEQSPKCAYERDEYTGFFRVRAAANWSYDLQHAVKTLLDCVIGLVGSLITLALCPFIAAILKLEDGGPLFYSREFVDCDGRVGHYLKFRTMRVDADEILEKDPVMKRHFEEKHKLERDPRVLRAGRLLRKFSIDEFPQFFSLLTGRLTFVGPRVISLVETTRYGECLNELLSVKPGMTGYWQVMGRQTTTYEERVRMDMFYIRNWSIWLDLVILGKTLGRVLGTQGAY